MSDRVSGKKGAYSMAGILRRAQFLPESSGSGEGGRKGIKWSSDDDRSKSILRA